MGLREANRQRVMGEARREALALFVKQGFEATTVEQIASAAGISSATFYRHFRAKEDVLFNEGYDPFLERAFAGRPAGEPLAEVVRTVYQEFAARLLEADHQALLLRHRLMSSVPALRDRLMREERTNLDQLVNLLADRVGRSPDDFEVRLAAAAVNAAFAQAAQYWLDRDCAPQLPDLMELAMDRIKGVLAF
ncbi:TetR/AcrR family transcriptional regulator [Streptomyces sp. NBC_00659]|uniref:TetR/AcrR family transcriptional regulator n=1 Tax=Streptomyces sp. NBC_00659 TaxID=2903669 RepID=UPI002E364958|nr:TetR family transcriptional regulator [Streptomyces sp. NBC_00659]